MFTSTDLARDQNSVLPTRCMRCLMLGARPSTEPLPAGDSSGSSTDEVTLLELASQRQLEEDIARIFDESIYSDLEVVCGKLKILTHSCILKARTLKFYHKLEAILHVNIGHNTFDEIYSFISDAYTECNIQQEEGKIIEYINENCNIGENLNNIPNHKPEEKVEPEVFLTPVCVSPEEKNYHKILSSNPSTELTKEYYALVPLERNILDKELLEQDALSNAFKSIKSQDINAKQSVPCCVKPTSLCLNYNPNPTNEHSNDCDILIKSVSNNDIIKNPIEFEDTKLKNGTSQTLKTCQRSEVDNKIIIYNENANCPDTSIEKALDPIYTPDSLITDDPSSSSDYLSATYAVSPRTVFSSGSPLLNVGESSTKMDNIVTVSDSGLETPGMHESLNSHKDLTLADVSLSDSTLHDMINDDYNVQDLASTNIDKSHVQPIKHSTTMSSPTCGTSTGKVVFSERKLNKSSLPEVNNTYTKEEKQRQNEEIVILESSSLSSETGSWESVFPPKPVEIEVSTSLVQKSLYKSTSCFIDAATLSDECGDVLTVQTERNDALNTSKRDMSPNDWSGSNDCEDSLELLYNENSAILEPTAAGPLCWCDSKIDVGSEISPNVTLPRETTYAGNGFIQAQGITERQCDSKMNVGSEISSNVKVTEETTYAGIGFIQAQGVTERKYDCKMDVGSEISPNVTLTGDFVCAGIGYIQAQGITERKYDSEMNVGSEISSNVKLTEETSCAGIGFIQAQGVTERKYDSKMNVESEISPNVTLTGDFICAGIGYIQTQGITEKGYDSEMDVGSEISPKVTLGGETIYAGNGFIQVRGITERITASDTTPNNSLITVRSKKYSQANTTSDSKCDNDILNHRIPSLFNSSPLSGSFTELVVERQVENAPIVSGACQPEPKHTQETKRTASTSSFWVDMATNSKSEDSDNQLNSQPTTEFIGELRSASQNSKGLSSVGSDSGEKSTHKFYIDLATLPDVLPPEQKQEDEGIEKKNMFSMFVDIGDNISTAKEMPARFSCKKITKPEQKNNCNKRPKNCDSKHSSFDTTKNRPSDESVMFEKLETLCNDPSIGITDILTRPEDETEEMYNDIKNKVIEEEQPTDELPAESLYSFVKLSDLDKVPPKSDPVTIINKADHERMTRSIPDNDWKESSQTLDSWSNQIINSFHSENALSLNRLFPNLKTDLSRSMPGSLSSRTRSPLRPPGRSASPGDINERQASDVSEMSSVQSSYCRSVVENSTTEEFDQVPSLMSNCTSILGQDLLRMFLEEIAPDVIVEVSGRRIKAHKCILSSRCQYFAGILSGGWVESAGNVIHLPPFKFSVVHFALCHIYTGITVIPDSISIVELATLADMLGLEGLQEGIMLTLKAKYCHHFHKPCDVCTAGVLECLKLCSIYGLDDLYRKCLRWISKYFVQVWPTKAFATLPTVLAEKCCHEHTINLTSDNFVDTVYGCGIIMWSLGKSRWAETVERMCRRLLNACTQFAANHLYAVVGAMRTAPAPSETLPAAAAHALYDCLAAAVERAAPDRTCRAYALLSAAAKEARLHRHHEDARSLLAVHAGPLSVLCEHSLVRNAPRVLHTAAFAELPEELRGRLRSLGCISLSSLAPTAAPYSPRPPRRLRPGPPSSAPMRSVDIDLVRARIRPSSGPQPSHAEKTARSSLPRDNRPIPKMLRTYPPSVRSTKAQEERARYNSIKTNQSAERAPVRVRGSYEHAKTRYMEPRKLQPKRVSSCESSRNSSPVHPRAPRNALPLTNSLPDKYATYTKAKHDAGGSVEAVSGPTESHAVTPATKSLPLASKGHTPLKGTKIPVSTNKNRTTNPLPVSKGNQLSDKSVNRSSSILSRNKPKEHKPSGSLMNATKSSQAKIVSKTIKETNNTRHVKNQEYRASRGEEASDIPIMERSGTFLKDEPSLDITKNFDINE